MYLKYQTDILIILIYATCHGMDICRHIYFLLSSYFASFREVVAEGSNNLNICIQSRKITVVVHWYKAAHFSSISGTSLTTPDDFITKPEQSSSTVS